MSPTFYCIQELFPNPSPLRDSDMDQGVLANYRMTEHLREICSIFFQHFCFKVAHTFFVPKQNPFFRQTHMLVKCCPLHPFRKRFRQTGKEAKRVQPASCLVSSKAQESSSFSPSILALRKWLLYFISVLVIPANFSSIFDLDLRQQELMIREMIKREQNPATVLPFSFLIRQNFVSNVGENMRRKKNWPG